MKNRGNWRSNAAFVIMVAITAYVMYKARKYFGFGDDGTVPARNSDPVGPSA